MIWEPAKPEFRGARDYYHSTSIYQDILDATQALGIDFAGPITLKISKRITRAPVYNFDPAILDGANATCTFGNRAVAVSETANPVAARKPYDEAAAFPLAEFTERSVSPSAMLPLRPIEAITALATELHKRSFPHRGKRWMLTQLDLSRPLHEGDRYGWTFTIAQLHAERMTRSSLTEIDGQPFGAASFTLV